MTHVSLYCSSPSKFCTGIDSFSVFCFQINIIDSSSPEARSCPFGAHRTTFTAFWCRVRSAATSTFTDPVSVMEMYQIWWIGWTKRIKLSYVWKWCYIQLIVKLMFWILYLLNYIFLIKKQIIRKNTVPKHENRFLQWLVVKGHFRKFLAENPHSKLDPCCAKKFLGLRTSLFNLF